MTYNGRVEARVIVPSGGAFVSASNGAHSSAVSVSIPAGSYYPSASGGGVPSLIGTLQTKLNENVQGYPQSLSALAAAIGGYGNLTAASSSGGWLCNEPSGSLAAAYGSPTLTVVSSPTHGTAGPRGGIDKAVGFDSAADGFSGGNVHNVNATNDLFFSWVAYVSAVPGASRDWFGKRSGGAGWYIVRSSTGLFFFTDDGVDSPSCTIATVPLGEFHVGLGVIERATNKMRIVVKGLTSGTVVTSTEVSTTALGDMTNAVNFTLGAGNWASADTDLKLAAFYVAIGSGIATGMSTNLSTAVANLANAINSSFTVALSTEGQVTLSNSFWPASAVFTTTALRDVLGFEYDFDYPPNAAAMAIAAGRGTWSLGCKCDASSGNLPSSFGTGTWVPTGSPTYSNLGSRGGNDKAVGFAAGNHKFSAGNILDVGAADDLILAWAGKFTGVPNDFSTMFSKTVAALASGWVLSPTNSTTLSISGTGSGTGLTTDWMIGQQHVGMAVIERATGRMRVAMQSLVTGTLAISAEVASQASYSTSGDLTIGASAWTNVSAPFECSAFFIGVGPGYATGVSANLATAIASFATYMKSQAGTLHARGVWVPDCPLTLRGDPKRAPLKSDLRQGMSGTGHTVGLVSSYFKRHKALAWTHVPIDRTWEAEAVYTYASWEWFFKETQLNLGGTGWFTVASPLQIYDHENNLVGVDDNSGTGTTGWTIMGVDSIEPEPSIENWTGRWRIEIPTIVAIGG